MNQSWIHLPGRLTRGQRVASGPSWLYPYGSVEKQKPYFEKLGLDLSSYFDGTLNFSISPTEWKMKKPEFTFRRVKWTDLHPPEDFSFSRCWLRFGGKEYEGWVYYPHPETKMFDFQDSSQIEIIAYKIPNLHYGDEVEVELNPDEISIIRFLNLIQPD